MKPVVRVVKERVNSFSTYSENFHILVLLAVTYAKHVTKLSAISLLFIQYFTPV